VNMMSHRVRAKVSGRLTRPGDPGACGSFQVAGKVPRRERGETRVGGEDSATKVVEGTRGGRGGRVISFPDFGEKKFRNG